ncbi:threonine-phosphate decarboxylase CobD [Fredinandcohnia quinoae]
MPSHGSNPKYVYEAMGIQIPNQYIDLSANINPLGPPQALSEKWKVFFKQIVDYPDPYALSLKEVIMEKEKMDHDWLLIGNGGSELITLVARFLAKKRVLIIQPTFSEYEKACRVNECDVSYFRLNEPNWELDIDRLIPLLENADAIFLCNPNNPTGILYPQSTILRLIKECKRAGCFVVLDEAFYDFVETYESSVGLCKDFSNVIVLRSMTKMFAIPGLRLGYAVTNPMIIKELSAFQSHWSVNTLALLAGEVCLQNEAFILMTQEYIAKERQKLFQFFQKEAFITSASRVNFYLLRDPKIENQKLLFRFLLEKGIVARHTFNFPGLDGNWLRFAIKSTHENERLMEVLTEWRMSHH